ncbi:DUF4393 domain-containing protein [Bacillus tropicus]|uniref:DUF4393 domain-containing protein n=1 Tax=Bacillus tropicus TaxID=2026188 RepID=UPI0023AF2378|nr:DUF4393 domain-containing protein [Bacillus tropicus]MDE7553017.1 DUF4393 domain-containing protein [Bacillus tropicus]MDE7574159.1 DUF4393 domain-containing protein [Bacillus tropicus]
MTNNNESQNKDSSNVNTNISVLPNIIGSTMPLLTQIYTDLASPSIKKIGQSLETVLDVAQTTLLPIKFWSEKKKITFEKNLEKYKEKLEKINESNIIDVTPEIGVPIIEKLTYTSNEELSELFTNLLAKTASSENVHLGHPGFIKIIESLSVDEARIVQYISTHYTNQKIETIPYINIRLKHKNKDGGTNLLQYLTGIEKEIELVYPDNIQLYLENLVSLGILENQNGRVLTSNQRYENVENKYQDLMKDIQEGLKTDELWDTFKIEKGFYSITKYANSFIKACVK